MSPRNRLPPLRRILRGGLRAAAALLLSLAFLCADFVPLRAGDGARLHPAPAGRAASPLPEAGPADVRA
jgi:hypothetical protein